MEVLAWVHTTVTGMQYTRTSGMYVPMHNIHTYIHTYTVREIWLTKPMCIYTLELSVCDN